MSLENETVLLCVIFLSFFSKKIAFVYEHKLFIPYRVGKDRREKDKC